MPKPLTSAPGTRRSAVTDAVGLEPSLLPRPGAVAITHRHHLRVSGVVWGDACRSPGVRLRVTLSGLARESVGGVGFEVGL